MTLFPKAILSRRELRADFSAHLGCGGCRSQGIWNGRCRGRDTILCREVFG